MMGHSLLYSVTGLPLATRHAFAMANKTGSWNNLDADFGSWTQNAGFCIIGLHHLDSISDAGDGLVAISLRALDKPFPARKPRLHDFDRKLTNCMEHDVLPVV
jgi:hypothetical protein